jgi:hypothetical protein
LHEISAAAGFDVVRNFLVCVWLFWEWHTMLMPYMKPLSKFI